MDDVDRVSIDVRVRRAVAVDDLDSWAVLVKVDELVPLFVFIWLVVTVGVEITDFVD